MKGPNIFEYHDYRAFLKAHLAWKKGENPSFSMRCLSRHAGFDGHAFLGYILQGKRNLSPRSIRKVIRALGLKKDEQEYFENMVLMNQATASEDKNHFYRKMSSARKYLKVHQLGRDQYEFYSKWYYTVIREMVALPDFREDSAWIAKRLQSRITANEAADGIDLLLQLGLIERGPEGKLRQVDPNLSTPAEIAHMTISNFHREMIDRARAAIDTVHSSERDISSITIPITEERFAHAREKIRAFRRELYAFLAEPAGAEKQKVYQINFQLFSLSGGEDA